MMTCLACGRLSERSYCPAHEREAQARRLAAVAARYGWRHAAARRAAIGSGGRWETLRRAVYRRQDGRCALCGWPLGERWEVDHIVPVARGGTSDLSNLRALHQACHRQVRGRRGAGESPSVGLQARAGAVDFSRGHDDSPGEPGR
jgi:5-methylcytosine-specific restriction protein A